MNGLIQGEEPVDASLQDTTVLPPEGSDFPPIPEDPRIKFPWSFLMRCSLVMKLRWLEERNIDPIEYLSAALEERFEKDTRFETSDS